MVKVEQLTEWRPPRFRLETLFGEVAWLEWLEIEKGRFEAAGRSVLVIKEGPKNYRRVALFEARGR